MEPVLAGAHCTSVALVRKVLGLFIWVNLCGERHWLRLLGICLCSTFCAALMLLCRVNAWRWKVFVMLTGAVVAVGVLICSVAWLGPG